MSRDSSPRFLRTAFASAAAITLGAFALGGCGVKGPLKLPPPATATPPASPSNMPVAPPAQPDLPQEERKP